MQKNFAKNSIFNPRKGIDLGCDYVIHFYGPYSSDLDFAVYELSNEGKLEIKYTPMEHIIKLADGVSPKLENDTINYVIDEFGNESPSELELIATALYVYTCSRNIDNIIDGVKKIKGSKYSDIRIKNAISKLERFGYFAA